MHPYFKLLKDIHEYYSIVVLYNVVYNAFKLANLGIKMAEQTDARVDCN